MLFNPNCTQAFTVCSQDSEGGAGKAHLKLWAVKTSETTSASVFLVRCHILLQLFLDFLQVKYLQISVWWNLWKRSFSINIMAWMNWISLTFLTCFCSFSVAHWSNFIMLNSRYNIWIIYGHFSCLTSFCQQCNKFKLSRETHFQKPQKVSLHPAEEGVLHNQAWRV